MRSDNDASDDFSLSRGGHPDHVGGADRMQVARDLLEDLKRYFGACFIAFDTTTGRVAARETDDPISIWDGWVERSRAVAANVRPELIDREGPLAVMAVPLPVAECEGLVALCVFLVARVHGRVETDQVANFLRADADRAERWLSRQSARDVDTLLGLADLWTEKVAVEQHAARLERGLTRLSSQLGSTYQEINLISRLSRSLRRSSGNRDVIELMLGWLLEAFPAEGAVIRLSPRDENHCDTTMRDHFGGRALIDSAAFDRLLAKVEIRSASGGLAITERQVAAENWEFPLVRDAVLAPLRDREGMFGCIAVFNLSREAKFGAVEANLLDAVADVLNTCDPRDWAGDVRQNLMAGMVRALSAAIDAKDPYTRGHGDRVARIARRLGQELGCDEATVTLLHVCGLLHDIGKIGVDDKVLRKAGKLNEAEFEHVKSHVKVGFHILKDFRPMSDALPAVLHHHEAWDGSGYPFGLEGEDIPLVARIVAVADAYDAMASDRPYRAAMDEDRIDRVLRAGASRQWDPTIINAFFQARVDLRAIEHPPCDNQPNRR